MAIRITTEPTTENLYACSHWWGFPDLPKDVLWPCRDCADNADDDTEELLTFVCQIRLEEIAELDKDGLLPHKGMLWFFADLDYFLGDMDAPCEGMGEWEESAFKVIYREECDELFTHKCYWEDGSPAVMEAEMMTFEATDNEEEFGMKLLGMPAMTEGYENENEGLVSLLQVDEDDRWQLRFFDSGCINFMMPIESLEERDFAKATLCLHSS